MHARVPSQFGMEACAQQVCLLGRHDGIVVQPAEHFDVWPDGFNLWCANEHALEGFAFNALYR